MRLILFDFDGTLIQTTKTDEECFVRSLADVCGFGDVIPIGRITGTRQIPAFSTRFIRPARDGIRRLSKCHGFVNIS